MKDTLCASNAAFPLKKVSAPSFIDIIVHVDPVLLWTADAVVFFCASLAHEVHASCVLACHRKAKKRRSLRFGSLGKCSLAAPNEIETFIDF